MFFYRGESLFLFFNKLLNNFIYLIQIKITLLPKGATYFGFFLYKSEMCLVLEIGLKSSSSSSIH